MKTLILYQETDNILQWALVEGDYSHLHGAMINVENTDKEREAIQLLFHPETGEMMIPLSTEIAMIESKDWDVVAVITFIG